MQDLIDLNEWFRHAITGLAQGAWIVWLRVVGELRVEGSGSSLGCACKRREKGEGGEGDSSEVPGSEAQTGVDDLCGGGWGVRWGAAEVHLLQYGPRGRGLGIRFYNPSVEQPGCLDYGL